jgi:hypothetical protein
MRPGRMKYKARARRRRVAVTAAGVGALTVLGGTAYASEGGVLHKEDPGTTLDNSGNATNRVEQESKVKTDQDATADTGGNLGLAIVGNVNIGSQDCKTNVQGGDLNDVEEKNSAGNDGGNCDNGARQTNRGTADASIDTGDANATNDATTTVRQRNSGDASVANTATDNKVEGDDSSGTLYNGGDAYLKVDQDSKVKTDQDASANTGGNYAIAAVIGVNYGQQTGATNVQGGNITDADDSNTAGNKGGNASNNATQTNNGTAGAHITTGNATASNSSTTTVNQTNSGSASVANTATGNTVGDD